MKSLGAIAIGTMVLASLGGCSTKDEQALGDVMIGANGNGPAVYRGDIKRKYSVIKELRERRVQRCGSNYYDQFSGMNWMKIGAKEVSADAVINYGDKIIQPENWLLSCGEFEVWGTAVKFAD